MPLKATARPDQPSKHTSTPQSFLNIMRYSVRWLLIASTIGLLAGTASAILIESLNWATNTRESHRWLIAILPIAGLLVGLLYHHFGRSVEAGNNLILEQIHAEVDQPTNATIQARMTPLILLGTFLTHLFGGSAGREGTAVQTGASLADQLTPLLRKLRIDVTQPNRRILLMAGVAAGFGSVFGTPIAGAVFGLEVLTVATPNHRTLNYRAVVPCFLASFVADITTHVWHVHHTVYVVTSEALSLATPTVANLFSSIAAGIAFGLTALFFTCFTHAIGRTFKRYISYPPLRPFIGGVIIASAVLLPLRSGIDTLRYIGLGIPTIAASFNQRLPRYDFAAKLAFTSITLGAGFKGGEVTPLFYIGATLGNALSSILPLPSSLLAAMGFVAVFAGAANTPIASTLMAYELFGPRAAAFAAIACVVSYLCSGTKGIYRTQRSTNRIEHSALRL
jgi:H+/Cl- antiporter ClcA